jgi:hypothetical protein
MNINYFCLISELLGKVLISLLDEAARVVGVIRDVDVGMSAGRSLSQTIITGSYLEGTCW